MERNSSHTDISIKAAWYKELLRIAKLEIDELAELDEDDLHHVYHYAFNGFSALLTAEQVAYLQSSHEVIQLQPDRLHNLAHTTHTPDFLGLADGHLCPESNYGDDVIVGVVDTGVWPERLSIGDQRLGPIPSRWKGICESGTNFSASQHCNRKLIGARAFYKGYEAQGGVIDEAGGECKSPRDSGGHCTHTASTAAGRWSYRASVANGVGRGTARGMVPKARLPVFKALWKSSADSDILAAIDQAVADGVDVLSLSLGAEYDPNNVAGSRKELWTDMTAIATYGAMKKGVFLSFSAGNDGPLNQSWGAVTNVAPWMTTVGASTTDRPFAADVVLGNGTVIYSESGLNTKVLGNDNPLIFGGDAPINDLVILLASYCINGTLDPALVRGKIVMCYTTADGDGAEVLEAGGSGVIYATPSPRGEEILVEFDHVLPTVRVGAAGGRIIRKYINSTNTPHAQLRLPGKTQYNRRPAPAVAAFSSRGPSFRDSWNVIKPDIIAPGVDILAAGIKAKQYAMMSGTSICVCWDTRRKSFELLTTYVASITDVENISISVHPPTLSFNDLNEKKSLILTVSATDSMEIGGYGSSITWSDGVHTVQSPIVIVNDSIGP